MLASNSLFLWSSNVLVVQISCEQDPDCKYSISALRVCSKNGDFFLIPFYVILSLYSFLDYAPVENVDMIWKCCSLEEIFSFFLSFKETKLKTPLSHRDVKS